MSKALIARPLSTKAQWLPRITVYVHQLAHHYLLMLALSIRVSTASCCVYRWVEYLIADDAHLSAVKPAGNDQRYSSTRLWLSVAANDAWRVVVWRFSVIKGWARWTPISFGITMDPENRRMLCDDWRCHRCRSYVYLSDGRSCRAAPYLYRRECANGFNYI